MVKPYPGPPCPPLKRPPPLSSLSANVLVSPALHSIREREDIEVVVVVKFAGHYTVRRLLIHNVLLSVFDMFHRPLG